MATALVPQLSLYHLPVQSPTSIPHHISGSFTAQNAAEIVTVTGGASLSLYRVSDSNSGGGSGPMTLLSTTPLFSEILSIVTFKFIGNSAVDYIAVTSDSGTLSVLVYDNDRHRFVSAQSMMIGKTGMRRGVPGYYIAADPHGRALMLAALEKSKMSFILNIDNAATGGSKKGMTQSLKLSSPLDANKSNILTLSLAAVDVGLDNPVFAAIETDYGDSGGDSDSGSVKFLTYYELDLGLNHVTRKHTERIDSAAHQLLPVPGTDTGGPGGLLVLCESYVYYYPYSLSSTQSSPVKVYYPRRHGIDINPTLLIVAHSRHLLKNDFFYFLQSEHGDLYKLTVQRGGDSTMETDDSGSGSVTNMTISYYDSIFPTTGFSILRNGHLFAASEAANHALFQIVSLGDNDSGNESDYVCSDVTHTSDGDEGNFIYFFPRKQHKNLLLIDSIDGRHPITDMRVSHSADVSDSGARSPVIYTVNGKGSRSTLRAVKYGLRINELAVTDLHAPPTGIFTVASTNTSTGYHRYIVLSFAKATIVLSVGDVVSEVTDSGLLDTVNTIYCTALSDGSIVQVHSAGLRHIRYQNDRQIINDWKSPSQKEVLLSTSNQCNVLLSLAGGEVCYFEQSRDGSLIDLYWKDLMQESVALAVAPVDRASGGQRGKYIAVACSDHSVRILNTEPAAPLQQTLVFAVNHPVSALYIQHRMNTDSGSDSWHFYTGCHNGILIQSSFDTSNGTLSKHKRKFLGPRPLAFAPYHYHSQQSLVIVSDRTWLDSHYQHYRSKLSLSHLLLPFHYDSVDLIAEFHSPQCHHGLVACIGNTLRILSVDDSNNIGELFHSQSVRLTYTPRKIEMLPHSQWLAVIETDHNTYNRQEKKELEKIINDSGNDSDNGTGSGGGSETVLTKEEEEFIAEYIGLPYAGDNHWASCMSLHPPSLSLSQSQSPTVIDFDDNEAAFSMALVQFDAQFGYDHCLAVGLVKDYQFRPRSFTHGAINLYSVEHSSGSDRPNVRFLHKTFVTDIPLAMAQFQKKLLVGVGTTLKLFEMGKKKLLLKLEFSLSKSVNCPIQSLAVIPHSDRIVVGTLTQGHVIVAYSALTKALHVVSDSAIPRFLTSSLLLDSDTIAGSDKFGNLFINRLPPSLANSESDGGSGDGSVSANNKLMDLASFHCDSIITALALVNLHPAPPSTTNRDNGNDSDDDNGSGTSPILLCSLLNGSLVAFAPLQSRAEIELLTLLELHVRSAYHSTLSLTQRDHLQYRGQYLPVKGVIDGQLLLQYQSLPKNKQLSIAEELNSSVEQIVNKLDEFVGRIV